MIRIDRASVTPPARWFKRADEATAELARAVRKGEFSIDRSVYGDRQLLAAIIDLFGNKCAYCESGLSSVDPDGVHPFRPPSAVLGLNARSRRPGYWWLAYEWENLYLSCLECASNKKDRFPVAGRPASGPADSLPREKAILIDPCADDPAEHFLFAADGHVASRSKVARGIDRGAVTIDVLGLNRPSLVAARKSVAEEVQHRLLQKLRFWRDVRPPANREIEVDAVSLISASIQRPHGFTAMQRQIAEDLMAQWLAEGSGQQTAAVRQEVERREEFFIRQSAHDEYLLRASVEDNPDLEAVQSQTLQSIELVNFRGIDRLEVRFGRGTAERAGWTMLLGENGVGKSSVLQALALALGGEDRVQDLQGDVQPADLLRRGTSKGHIRVYFSAHPDPLEVRLKPGGIEFGPAASRPRMFVLGFGSSRWLPRPGGFDPDRHDFVRIRNLFNPFVPLADTLEWLTGIDRDEFDPAQEALLRLLQLDAGERLERANGDILVRLPRRALKRAVSLRQLSDGYQSVISMAGDIMDLLSRKRIDLEAAEGIVLVDEVGAHLHPRWKMQVVSRLRNAFPRLQFVASTHDPLCLRGLHDDEVALLVRDHRGRVVRVEELPSVEALRVDQLLISPYFGLNSTMEPEVEALFEEYHELLARERLTKPERERLETLRAQLDTRELLGSTRREKELFDAIDAHLAREASALADGKDELLKQETSDVLAAILKKMDEETGEVLT